jgi:hypothetical protein
LALVKAGRPYQPGDQISYYVTGQGEGEDQRELQIGDRLG